MARICGSCLKVVIALCLCIFGKVRSTRVKEYWVSSSAFPIGSSANVQNEKIILAQFYQYVNDPRFSRADSECGKLILVCHWYSG